MIIKKLTTENIIHLHEQLIKATGGCHGIRDEGLLQSAVNAPFHSFDGIELYPSIYGKASKLGYSLTQNHAFIDGNKRIGAHAMLVFLKINNINLSYTQLELSNLFLEIAKGNISQDDLTNWIIAHTDRGY